MSQIQWDALDLSPLEVHTSTKAVADKGWLSAKIVAWTDPDRERFYSASAILEAMRHVRDIARLIGADMTAYSWSLCPKMRGYWACDTGAECASTLPLLVVYEGATAGIYHADNGRVVDVFSAGNLTLVPSILAPDAGRDVVPRTA